MAAAMDPVRPLEDKFLVTCPKTHSKCKNVNDHISQLLTDLEERVYLVIL